MSYQEFIIAFETLISGFAAARFFQGWGEMIKYRRKFSYYWGHTLTTLVAFFILIQQWWGAFGRPMTIVHNIWDFTFLLTIPAIFYFMSVQFFPNYRGQTVDLRHYFQSNLRFYGLYFFLYFFILTMRYIYYDLPMWDERGLTRTVGLVFSMAMIITNSRKLTEIIMIISGVMVIWFFSVVEPPPRALLHPTLPYTPMEAFPDSTSESP